LVIRGVCKGGFDDRRTVPHGGLKIGWSGKAASSQLGQAIAPESQRLTRPAPVRGIFHRAYGLIRWVFSGLGCCGSRRTGAGRIRGMATEKDSNEASSEKTLEQGVPADLGKLQRQLEQLVPTRRDEKQNDVRDSAGG